VVTLASSFSFNNLPGIAVDGSGNVFVADYGASKIYEILAAGGYTTVNTLGGSFSFNSPTGVAVDGSGNVYVADYSNNAVEEILAAGGYITVNTLGGGFSAPQGVAVDGRGNLNVADTNNNAVKEVPPGCGSARCVVTLGGGFNRPAGVNGGRKREHLHWRYQQRRSETDVCGLQERQLCGDSGQRLQFSSRRGGGR
jgi:NHL repeat